MAALPIRTYRRMPASFRSRAMALTMASILAFTFALAVALSGGGAPATVDLDTTATISQPHAAISAWLDDQGDVAFGEAGAGAAYLGECRDDAPAGTTGLCSRLVDDLGDTQVHIVGVAASDIGVDVLLEQTGDGRWRVAAVAPWPAPGDSTAYAGAPWSPTTAITRWWADRAADVYGAGAVHLPSCEDATPHDANAEPRQLCSTLAEDHGATRVYESGRAGAPADVRITVAERPDRTWQVTETLAR